MGFLVPGGDVCVYRYVGGYAHQLGEQGQTIEKERWEVILFFSSSFFFGDGKREKSVCVGAVREANFGKSGDERSKKGPKKKLN